MDATRQQQRITCWKVYQSRGQSDSPEQVQNNDLNQYTVNLEGESRVYRTGGWTYNLPANYGILNFTRHKTNSGYKRPSRLGYSTYPSPGDWYAAQWTETGDRVLPGMQSDLNFPGSGGSPPATAITRR